MINSPPIVVSLDMVIGEVRGQLREMITQANSNAHKLDIVVEKMAAMSTLPQDVAVLRAHNEHEFHEIKARLDTIETDKDKRDGAMTAFGRVINSPAFAWVATGAAGLYLFVSGHVHL